MCQVSAGRLTVPASALNHLGAVALCRWVALCSLQAVGASLSASLKPGLSTTAAKYFSIGFYLSEGVGFSVAYPPEYGVLSANNVIGSPEGV
jgi:hypothetical protein